MFVLSGEPSGRVPTFVSAIDFWFTGQRGKLADAWAAGAAVDFYARGRDARALAKLRIARRSEHRGSSLIRNCAPLGPYSRPMSRALRKSWAGGSDARALAKLRIARRSQYLKILRNSPLKNALFLMGTVFYQRGTPVKRSGHA